MQYKMKPGSVAIRVEAPVERRKMYKLDFSTKGAVRKIYVDNFSKGVYFEDKGENLQRAK